MGAEPEDFGRRPAGMSVVLRRIGYAGTVATAVFVVIYSLIFVIPNYDKWYANTLGQGGFGLFMTMLLAAILIPPAWAVLYLILWALGIPRIEGDRPRDEPIDR